MTKKEMEKLSKLKLEIFMKVAGDMTRAQNIARTVLEDESPEATQAVYELLPADDDEDEEKVLVEDLRRAREIAATLHKTDKPTLFAVLAVFGNVDKILNADDEDDDDADEDDADEEDND